MKNGVRCLDLWELVCWVYRDQKAHHYLDRVNDWFDWAIDMTTAGEIDVNVPVNYDAAMVHAEVIGLGFLRAQLILQQAIMGERPEMATTQPAAFPMPYSRNRDISDKRGWTERNGRREEYLIRSSGKVSMLEIVEAARTRGKGKLVRVDTTMRPVDIEYCPIEWFPDPAFVDMQNGIYREWTEAMLALALALDKVAFRHHVVVGFAFYEPLSFERPEEMPGAPRKKTTAYIEVLKGDVEMLDRSKGHDSDDVKVVRYRRVVGARVKTVPDQAA